jgi:putative PIN family toxin of toxin-antitoxin system
MIRIVIDTNVFISAFIKGGTPLAVLDVVHEQKALLLITSALLDELREVMRRPKFNPHFEQRGIDVEHLLLDYGRIARQVTSIKIDDQPVRDKKDLKFLECALGGKADYIITGDNDLLTLKEYEGISIVTPAQFLAILPPPSLKSADDTKSE